MTPDSLPGNFTYQCFEGTIVFYQILLNDISVESIDIFRVTLRSSLVFLMRVEFLCLETGLTRRPHRDRLRCSTCSKCPVYNSGHHSVESCTTLGRTTPAGPGVYRLARGRLPGAFSAEIRPRVSPAFRQDVIAISNLLRGAKQLRHYRWPV